MADIQPKAGETQSIILGLGKFSIDDVDIALTRGGGQFLVEREYRVMEADGLKAAGKNMILIDREQPKLTMNALSILQGADISKLYPAVKNSVGSLPASVKIDATVGLTIKPEDYHTVKWTGVTNEGKGIIITIEDAINLENIDWSLVDKDEVVQALTYTGTADMTTKQAKWSIDFLT